MVELDDGSGSGPRLHPYGSDTSILRVPLSGSVLRLRTAAGDVHELAIPTARPGAASATAAERPPDRPAHVFESPFPGLRPFETSEAPLFFGRSREVSAMRDLLERRRFLVVVGHPGIGKSSVVQAGLIPVLEAGDPDRSTQAWRIIIEPQVVDIMMTDTFDHPDGAPLLQATLRLLWDQARARGQGARG